MIFIVGILTFLLIVVCAALILLILVQLPKKDSGAGLAFGGGAADALFGAGSGNALTKITKWATVVFVVLTVFLGTLEIKMHNGGQSEFEQGVLQQQQMQGSPQMQAPTSSSQSPSSPASTPTTSMPLTTPAPSAPSVPATTSTNGK
jgi:protein translocase SecG subunit